MKMQMKAYRYLILLGPYLGWSPLLYFGGESQGAVFLAIISTVFSLVLALYWLLIIPFSPREERLQLAICSAAVSIPGLHPFIFVALWMLREIL